MGNIEIGDFSKVLKNEFNKYTNEISTKIKKETDKAMKKLVSSTKDDAPELTGDYKESITSTTVKETAFSKVKVWYVKNGEHTLPHLLEDGHALRNGGRAKAHPHIRKNLADVTEEFEKKVEEIIKNESN